MAFVWASFGIHAMASVQQDSVRSLPVIRISAPNGIIWGQPLTLAHFSITDPNGESFSSPIGIKIHGGSSVGFPKRSYRIEFWADESGTVTENHSLLNMRSDDDWFLIAAYNEPLRARSITCYDLWREMHYPYYQALEPEAQSCVHMDYAEVYLNDVYYGIYLVTEKVDKKQLKLKSYNGNIRGELYKGKEWGATTYGSVPEGYDNSQTMMGGFEFKYPDEAIDWANLYNFIDFVVNSDDDDFYADIYHRVQIDNMVDYFIFINVLNAMDNTGKNIYVARYKENEPYFFVPWDMDATLGDKYDGTPWPEYTGILSNGLFDRLLQDKEHGGFCSKVMHRWAALRGTTLSHQHIMYRYQTHVNFLRYSGYYAKEHMAWPDFTFDASHVDYVSDWLANRLAWLDGYISLLDVETHDEPLCGLYPNPATDQATLVSTSPIEQISIATLDGRIVSQQKGTSAPTATLQLSGLHPGMYIVTVRSTASQSSLKLIVQ